MNSFTEKLLKVFEANKNADNAVGMAKYMKDKFQFFGIKTPERKKLVQELIKQNGFPKEEELEQIILDLWADPNRECQYVAVSLLEKAIKRNYKLDYISISEKLITDKSWWDTVDGLAGWVVGSKLKNNPNELEITERWMKSGNIWLQRTCLLFQLKYKEETDTELLSSFIERLKNSDEFFIQKAIGWILREYSKSNKEFVINFIEKNDLANLSKREGLKWLKNKGMI